MRFIIAPIVFIGTYVILGLWLNMHHAIALTMESGFQISWASIIAVCMSGATFHAMG